MAERKAFISPITAIYVGCVLSVLLIGLLTYFGSLPTAITPAGIVNGDAQGRPA
jgi:hypothetical protein